MAGAKGRRTQRGHGSMSKLYSTAFEVFVLDSQYSGSGGRMVEPEWRTGFEETEGGRPAARGLLLAKERGDDKS